MESSTDKPKQGRPPLEPRIAELERKVEALQAQLTRLLNLTPVVAGHAAAQPLHSAQNATWRP